jgi:hypothetical protein
LLAFADKVDPAEIINHLRASVAARTGKAARDAIGRRENEAPLPFMRLLDASAASTSG